MAVALARMTCSAGGGRSAQDNESFGSTGGLGPVPPLNMRRACQPLPTGPRPSIEAGQMSERNEMRAFMRQMLGPDWEFRMLLADAIAGPDATNEDANAAQLRAVELVCVVRHDWTLERRAAVANAWRVLYRE